MPTSRAFAWNPTPTPPTGATQVGNIAIETNGFFNTTGGLEWFNGPDEDPGYVICHISGPRTAGSFSMVISGTTIGFWRTPTKTDQEFLDLIEVTTGQSFITASVANDWLLANGYWTSYNGMNIGNLIMELAAENGFSFGTYWIDSSGNNNDGELSGAILPLISYYNDYKVVSFSDEPDFINGTTPPASFIQSTGFGTQLDSDFTFEVWANSGTSSNGTLIAEWSGPAPTGWCDAQMAFVGGKINIGVYPGGYIEGPTFSPNTWYQIVSVYESGVLTLYVDGLIVASQSLAKSNPGDTHLTLARDDGANFYLNGASGYLIGRVAVWRIYDYAINQSQISSNFSDYSQKYDNRLVLSLDANNSRSYGSYPTFPTYGSTWYDLSYKGNNGTISGATYSSVGTASTFYFDGNDYVSIGQPIPTGSSYSITAWVYATNVSAARNIVSSNLSPFWINSGTLYAGVGGSYTEVSSPSFPTNTWKHVAVTFNDNSNTMKLYVNGVEVDQNTNVTASYTAQNTFIGSHFGVSPVSFFIGHISQVNIYTNAQTGSQILDNFNNTKSKYGI